jgi:hypothetical protein
MLVLPTLSATPPPQAVPLRLVKKVRDFLTALSAEHFELLQNAITEKLDKSSFSTAVYLISSGAFAPSSSPAARMYFLRNIGFYNLQYSYTGEAMRKP